jgi:hypothetical protein
MFSSIMRLSMCACSLQSSNKRESVEAIRKLAKLRNVSRACFETVRIAFIKKDFARATSGVGSEIEVDQY